MSSKLEKAQWEYERLLRDLGTKAEMLDMLSRADPALIGAYRQAGDDLADRKLELEFLQSEISGHQENKDRRCKELQEQIRGLQNTLAQQSKAIEVKKSKASPLRTKLAGAEYDLRYSEKALEDEMLKKRQAQEKEDWDKVKNYENKIKQMKIDILKRRGHLEKLRQQIGEFEDPAEEMKRSAENLQKRIAEVETELDELKNEDDEELLADLRRQMEEKSQEIKSGEQRLLDALADLGEDLYECRLAHPVLEKFYQDLDKLAAVIDQLQDGK